MTRTIQSTCPECGGIGFVRNRHITNRRNRKKCIECGGKGEIPVVIQLEDKNFKQHHHFGKEIFTSKKTAQDIPAIQRKVQQALNYLDHEKGMGLDL